jgi:hypothetical protein
MATEENMGWFAVLEAYGYSFPVADMVTDIHKRCIKRIECVVVNFNNIEIGIARDNHRINRHAMRTNGLAVSPL